MTCVSPVLSPVSPLTSFTFALLIFSSDFLSIAALATSVMLKMGVWLDAISEFPSYLFAGGVGDYVYSIAIPSVTLP